MRDVENALLLIATVGLLACNNSRLESPSRSDGGDGGTGAIGQSGAGHGGSARAGGEMGGVDYDASQGGTGSATGGVTTSAAGAGGTTGAGGTGGVTTTAPGAGGTTGASSTMCQPSSCPISTCVSGTMLNPSNPCDCPVCAPTDAGTPEESDAGSETATDARSVAALTDAGIPLIHIPTAASCPSQRGFGPVVVPEPPGPPFCMADSQCTAGLNGRCYLFGRPVHS